MKVCSKCHIEKDESEFSKGKSRPCKKCCSIAQKEYQKSELVKERNRIKAKKYYHENLKKNPDKIKRIRLKERESSKRYRQNNKKKRKDSSRAYYFRNIERIKEYCRKHRIMNKEAIAKRMKKWYYSDLEKSRRLGRESAKRNYNSEKAIEAARKFRKEHPDIVKKMKIEWEVKNPIKHKLGLHKRGKRMREELRDSYIRHQLINQGFIKEQIDSELIEIKKQIILIKRKLKNHVKENKKADKQPTRTSL